MLSPTALSTARRRPLESIAEAKRSARSSQGVQRGTASRLATPVVFYATLDGMPTTAERATLLPLAVYHGVSYQTAPHNAYTETIRFRRIAERLGAPTTMPDGLGTRPFADDLPPVQRPKSGSISVPYYRGASTYLYDHATNSYLRSVAGKAQRDALDGTRVTTRNVVVLFMALSTDPQSEPGYHRPVLAQIGTGKALIFRDGGIVVGMWRKDGAADLTRFYDKSGNEVTLVRGRIFIQVVATGTKVTYDAPTILVASPAPSPIPSSGPTSP